MKKITTTLLAVLCLCLAVSAQTIGYSNTTYFAACEASTNGIIPPTGIATPGLFPADSVLPCITSGTYVSDTLNFVNFSDISGLPVNFVKFDSIYLPTGLCWSTNRSNDSFGTGEGGIILIQGTTTAPAGQYKLRMIIDIGAGPNNQNVINLTNQDFDLLIHFRYNLRVACSNGSCASINTLDTTDAFISNYICSNNPIPLSATVTPAGTQDICPGTTAYLTANAGNGYTYLWSTGSTYNSIPVTTAGTYTVTVYSSGDSAVSAPVIVTAQAAPYAYFQLIPDPNTPHTWTVVNQCTGQGAINYTWYWGDTSSPSTGATPSHTYDTAGYYNICVFVSDSSVCTSHYCDTNAYLYKTDNQMISMTVVQYALGISDINQKPISMSYYANAIHFSENLTTANIKLYDLSGKTVIKLNNWSGNSIPVDNAIANGMYIIAVQNSNISVSHKLDIVR